MRKTLLRLVLGICALAAFTSCGGEKASGTGEFATVYVTAVGATGALDSDVTNWVDASGNKATECDPTSFMSTTPDTVDFTLTSTAYTQPNTGSSTSITPSPVAISRITVTLTPGPGAPPVLPAQYQSFDVSATAPQILPGASQIVPVRIVDNDLKQFFVNSLGTQSISCSNNPIYKYWATVTFEMREISTNRVSTVTPTGALLVNFSDFIDK